MESKSTTRRNALRLAISGAAVMATSGSFLDAWAASRSMKRGMTPASKLGKNQLPLKGGGVLQMTKKGNEWVGTYTDKSGKQKPAPTGTLTLENGRQMVFDGGRLLKGPGTIADWGWGAFADFDKADSGRMLQNLERRMLN